jgi:hypothetical protein
MIVEDHCIDCGQLVVPGKHTGHHGHFTGSWYCHDCGVLCDGGDDVIECPNHGGAFDCTPFCEICAGEQEYVMGALFGKTIKMIGRHTND